MSNLQNNFNIEVQGNSNSDITITPNAQSQIILDTPSKNTLVITKTEGVSNYNALSGKPSINGVELQGNKTTQDLHINLPNIISEFDIEVEREQNDIYNVPAIHQLLEIFAWEITQMQEELKSKEQVYIDVNLNYFPNEGRLSLRNWKTTDAYSVADEANQAGKPVIVRGSLYLNDEYIETVYLNQTIYADTEFGHFKYFLGLIDTTIVGFLRLEQGKVVVGMRQF